MSQRKRVSSVADVARHSGAYVIVLIVGSTRIAIRNFDTPGK